MIMDVALAFEKIKDWFDEHDKKVLEAEGKSFFRTSHGLWGSSGMMDVYELFLQHNLGDKFFADYGCGDGRIVLIAALFTQAVGIEGDEEVLQVAQKAKEELIKDIPELSRASFKLSNYYEENHNAYDILFLYPDHPFPEKFEKELLECFSGYVLVYNDIHKPALLKKGKTYWYLQVPIVSYPLGDVEESFMKRQ